MGWAMAERLPRGELRCRQLRCRQLRCAMWLAVSAFPLAGCQPGAEEPATQGTAGGETARPEPGDASAAGSGAASASADSGGASVAATSPSAAAAPAENPASAESAQSAQSAWGDPVANSGRPLPPRRPLAGAALAAYRQGLNAARQGDQNGAIRAFRQVLQADANAYQAAFNLGVLADRSGQDERAIQFYRQALRAQPDYERAARGIVTIELRRRNNSAAVSFMRDLAQRWERNLELTAIYGDVLVSADRPEEAIETARRALRRDERFVPAMIVLVKANLALGRTELAQSILDQAIETNDQVAELHFLKARMQQEEGNLAPALASYRRAIQRAPEYTEARMALGLAQLTAGNYNDALSQFQIAARLAPTLLAVRLALGDAYRATQQWAQAKAEFDRVQAMNPDNAPVHFNLGLMYMAALDAFPGLSTMQALQRAQGEFNRYRELSGPRSPRREDPAQGYLEEIDRRIQREQRRLDREARRAERARQRAARQAAEAGEGAQ